MRTGAALQLRRALATALHLLGGVRIAVAGSSMIPALRDGDHLLISRTAYRLRSPRRGEIVYVRSWAGAPGQPECIKRIIGLPGELIRLAGDGLSIDGRALIEPYLPAAATSAVRYADAFPEPSPGREWQLGPGEYFLLGDNRDASSDSRVYGPARRRDLTGLAWYRYAPEQRKGRIPASKPQLAR